VPVAAPSVSVPTAVPVLADADFSAAGSGWALYAPQLTAALGGEPQVWDVQALPDIAAGMPWIAATLQAGRGLDPAVIQPLYLRNKVALTKAEQEAARR
jgi:tRNA threonylcarbamoyladenosine biosynthesis protein TsaB